MSKSPSDAWPSAALSVELRRLNRQHLQDSHIAFLRGRECWPNQQFEQFAEEIRLANSLAITPLSPEQPEFFQLLASGQRFNWAILLDGSVRISPSIILTEDESFRISHAILCYNGGDVLAAGEGNAGSYLSNTTGHYKNEEFVVLPVRAAFAKIGILFKE